MAARFFSHEIGSVAACGARAVLQERAYEPLGATAPVAADVRVIAATNRDLAARVAEGSFRADLYYRINVISFELPPLAERPEDIPLLVAHFIEALNAEQGRSVRGFSSSALERLMHYSFPGNIRELRNIVERAYVLCRCEEFLNVACRPNSRTARAVWAGTCGGRTLCEPAPTAADAERAAIEAALRASNGSRKEAAARLDIDPATLWRKMKRHGLLLGQRDARLHAQKSILYIAK
jgi:DNA-binding NtrC family response regulator